jgi:hypothetical protein
MNHQPEGPTSERSEFRWPALSLLLILFVVTLALSATRTHDYCSTDLVAYHSATELFFEGINPYDPEQIAQAQNSECPESQRSVQVWNPPLIFPVLGPLFLLTSRSTSFLCAVVSIAACLILVAAGLIQVPSKVKLSAALICLLVLGFRPILVEVRFGQWSSIVAAGVALSSVYFIRRADFVAGLLLAVSIFKPHVAFLPVLYLVCVSIVARRWKIFYGSVLFTVFGFMLAELLHPGITQKWLYRETWPAQYLGSSLSSLFRVMISNHYEVKLGPIEGLLPTILAIAGIAARGWFSEGFQTRRFMLCCFAASLVAPYGFYFDQVILLVPLGYFLGRFMAQERDAYWAFRLSIVTSLLIVTWLPLSHATLGSILPLSGEWFIYPLCLGLIILTINGFAGCKKPGVCER